MIRTNPNGTETVVGVLGEMYAHMSRAAKFAYAETDAQIRNARAVRNDTGATYRAAGAR